jgi:hypothetical protein
MFQIKNDGIEIREETGFLLTGNINNPSPIQSLGKHIKTGYVKNKAHALIQGSNIIEVSESHQQRYNRHEYKAYRV